jgi:putative ABC transport system substrate-binding protein
MSKKGIGAVVIPKSTLFIANAGGLAAITAKKRIPSAGLIEFAEAGGLLAYGINQLEIWRRASYFMDKIFRGIKPGDIPVEQPTKFELAVNMKTAKVLGIKIPPSVMVRADKVIE